MPIYLRTLSRLLVLLFLWMASGASVSAQAITDAAQRQDANAVERILRADPNAVNRVDSDGNAALHHVAWLGNWRITQLLLKYRADVNVKQRDGWTPMTSAAAGNHADILQLLLDHGADTDARSNDGNAPIHFAARYAAAEAINFLVSNGVDIDTLNSDGNTPLAVAAWYGDVHTGQFLVSAGADLTVKNRFGRTALDEANRSGKADFVRMLTDYQQALDERAARDLARQTSGLNLRTDFAAWSDARARTQIVYREECREAAPGPEWRSTALGSNAGPLRISATPIGGRRFLGEFGNQSLLLTLADLPEHKEIAISFDLYIIRSMEGNLLYVGPDLWSLGIVDGPTLLQTTFANLRTAVRRGVKIQAYPGEYPGDHHDPETGASETNTLGFKHKNDPLPSMDSVYSIKYTFTNSSRALLLRFSGNNMEAPDDESWGITNIQVAVAAAPTIAPSTGPVIRPSAKPTSVRPPVRSHAVAGRHVARLPAPRIVERRAKPTPKRAASPIVKRIHAKKTAPKP